MKDFDEILKQWESEAKSKGYTKYIQHWRGQDYSYGKNFNGYSVSMLIYNYRKYNIDADNVARMFVCLLKHPEKRIDLVVSDEEMTLEKFENMSKEFYENFGKYFKDE